MVSALSMDAPTTTSGQSLGGGTSPVLTPEQLRERRLQALTGSGGSFATSNNLPNTSASAASPKQRATVHFDESVADEDSELQAALALSLQTLEEEQQQMETHKTQTASAAPTLQVDNHASIAPTPFTHLTNVWNTRQAYHVSDFHDIMWDSMTTTEEDKRRWLSEAIRTLQTTTATATNTASNDNTATMYSQIVQSHHSVWGLTQHFGGPCGVLAAVQAEMLKILVWGRRTAVNEHNNNNASCDLMMPRAPMQLLENVALTSPIVRVAMARAIAYVLARAVVQPPVSGQDDDDHDNAGESESNMNVANDKTSNAVAADAVRIVLPARLVPPNSTNSITANGGSMDLPPAIIWSDLEPWTAAAADKSKTTNVSGSRRLHVYTIPSTPHLSEAWNKRQRTHSDPMESAAAPRSDHRHDGGSNDDSNASLEERIHALSQVVGDFLLQPSVTSMAPIDYFCREGGVLLLVMSLVASRGKSLIQSEFDDSSGSKLTAQFGHCSQELMNLLLTGQAVSNVFDNNLSPDKGILCRGIQQQSEIGYLSQLESLRYCQVGSYYKSSRFPIFVVGSTSHFTVLFGDDLALKESESDRLLEQCRRAFKGVNGAEDNGFIASNQLAEAFQALELNVNGAEQAIAASIEVPGSSIILWQDFWKVTSKLMTGVSVETVLSSNDGEVQIVPAPVGRPVFGENDVDDLPPLVPITQFESDEDIARRMDLELNSDRGAGGVIVVDSAARSCSPMEIETVDDRYVSDEELARKLQAEWDAEGDGSRHSDRAVNGSPVTLPESDFPMRQPDPPTPPRGKDSNVKMRDEGNDDSFILYHYNGLRGGKVAPLQITRLKSEEAIGVNAGLNNEMHSSGGLGGGLGDIVWTKWQSCKISWMGDVPDID
ncbi:hypothetical protein MPSEU_000626800 [Mayamaea pseudoterrestris]|nr:hypothetical protein MPSEU_000626800 [Mayamaea pseudoterrestris]